MHYIPSLFLYLGFWDVAHSVAVKTGDYQRLLSINGAALAL